MKSDEAEAAEALKHLTTAVHMMLADAHQRPVPPASDGRWLVKDKRVKALRRALSFADRVLDAAELE